MRRRTCEMVANPGASGVSASVSSGTPSKVEQYGWASYDWANSVFSTTVVTVFLMGSTSLSVMGALAA